ncbi:MAG: hypothetical protein FJ319_03915 [SAR202 cluster bacterium]|nr:hypothetical protein [SAR202 cluster bacterium]
MPDVSLPKLDGAPYFNYSMRQFLIEGSHNIIPSRPVDVGNRRQLLMDRHVVDSTWNMFRVVHQPKKHPNNPLIPSEPTDKENRYRVPAMWGSVWQDAPGDKLRMVAMTIDTYLPVWDSNVQTYWESTDGVKWYAPSLGIVEWKGSKDNSVIQPTNNLSYGSGGSVIPLPERMRHKGRYAMVYSASRQKFNPGMKHGMADDLAWSEDGIHWTPDPASPVFAGRNDTFVNVVHNEDRDVFMMYRRATVNAHESRKFAYSESRDLVSWTQPEVILDMDEMDPPALYDFVVSKYGGLYLGMFCSFYAANAGYKNGSRLWRHGHVEKNLQIDVQLAWSRDGKTWDRHPRRPIFIVNGPWAKESAYDRGMIIGCQGMIEMGEEVYIYYSGSSLLHTTMPGTYGNFCLATIRKDGFVSLGTLGESEHPGYMLTKPLLCPGGKLRINAKTAPGGRILVAVRDGNGVQDGNWFEGWNFEDMKPFAGDNTSHVFEWNGHANFDAFKGKSVRLHFWMENAEMYSFWFE